MLNALRKKQHDTLALKFALHLPAVFDPKKTFLRFPTPGFKTGLLPSLAGDVI